MKKMLEPDSATQWEKTMKDKKLATVLIESENKVIVEDKTKENNSKYFQVEYFDLTQQELDEMFPPDVIKKLKDGLYGK